ncbi:MAG TPA: GldG family protein [Verrucomicrobiae bacterium]
MSHDAKSRPSFSRAGRWGTGFDLALRTALVLVVAVMVNFIGSKYYHWFYLSAQTQVQLSPRTLAVLHSLTNRVDVTLYYDTQDASDFYPEIKALLDQYTAVNRKIFVHTVDYVRDAGAAEKVKSQFGLNSAKDKNLVIFSLDGGRHKVFPGDALLQYKYEAKAPADPNKPLQFDMERKPVQFKGEMAFTAMLLALENPQPLKAYFLQGDGEPSLTDNDKLGYQKFGSIIEQNYIAVTNLSLAGGAEIPMDCDLLIIAGPTRELFPTDLQKIDQYLKEGGRLLVMFNFYSIEHPTGLEPILQRWGLNVIPDIAQDLNHTTAADDIVVDQNHFGKHPVMDALAQFQLQLYSPRPVEKLNLQNVNAPQVDELFWTSPDATLVNHPSVPPHSYPLACAVEQKPVAGVANPRGNTRIIAIGDSIFFGNYPIDSGANRDFLNSALNWLVDRPQLVAGIGPRPVTEFRLTLTQQQQRQLRWLLLAALPGGVLVLGWFVWLVRRK